MVKIVQTLDLHREMYAGTDPTGDRVVSAI